MSTLTTTKPKTETKLNEAISGVIAAVQEDPKNAAATFSVNSKLEEGFHSRIKARDFDFVSDEPEALGGKDAGPNPVEYVLGALAACQEIVIKAHAGQLGIDLKSVKVDVSGDLDLHGFFALSDARPGFTNVRYQTFIETEEEDPVKLQKLKDLSLENCPVLDIIKNPVPVSGEVSYINN
ncbi:MAG TPA: osmotically inducible protein OsmC [Balneolaceae bacterium]|nr:osmotically inducible protein OsmC [Balneolaceae bacterium]